MKAKSIIATARLSFALASAIAALLAASHTQAATFSSSATPPSVNGADISNFGTQTGSDKWFFQAKNEVDPADWAKGQTFTTGALPVLLKALTYKIDPTQKKPAETTYTIRVGTISGTTFNQIASETATQTVDTGVGDYMTWTFTTPILLSPNTTYGIDVAMLSAVIWNGGIPYLSYTADAYAGGQFYNSGPTGGSGSGPTIAVNAALDRVFHLDIIPPSPPSAYWDLNDTAAGTGGTAPSGIWDTSAKWNATSDGTGSTAAWTAGLTAVFAAGTDATDSYTVTVDGTQDIGGLSFEEGTVTVTGGAALRMTGYTMMNVAAALTATVATPISEDAAGRVLNKNGDGTLILSGTGSYSGATQVVAGTLRLGASGVLPAASAVTVGGTAPGATATLDLNGNSQTIASLTLMNGAAVATGAGTLALGGDVTYATGPLGATISGKLDLGTANRTFTVDNSTTAADDLTISAGISGTDVGLSKAGAGTLVLSGTNTYNGPTTVDAGTLQIGNGGTTGSLNLNSEIDVYGNLTFNRSDTVTQGTHFSAAAIIGSGSLTQAGSGTLVLSADNTYAGATTVSAGTLTIGSATALQDSTLNLSGGIFDRNGFSPTVGGLAGNGNLDLAGGTLTVGQNHASTTYSGILSGGTLVKVGMGTLSLSGPNTPTSTIITAGTLAFAAGSLGNGNITFSDSSTLQWSAGNTEDVSSGGRIQTLPGGVTATLNTGNNTVVLSGTLGGSGGIAKDGAGTLVLSSTNAYSGPTTVTAGTLQIGNGGTTGSLNPNSEITVDGNLTFNRSDTITQGTGFSAAAITGSGSLTQAGTGTLVLSADNTYAGATTVSAGILQVNGSLASPGGLVSVGPGGTLNVGTSGNIARDLTIAGGAVNLAGTLAGTLKVTGGTVTTSAGTPTVATADFSVGAGTATATTPLTITNALKLPGGVTATLSGGTSFTATGSNLAANDVARTLSLSGGTLALSRPSAGPVIDLRGLASGSNVPGDTTGSEGTHIKASSYYKNDGRAPWHVSNWSGMTGTFPTATAISTAPGHTMWLSNGTTGTGTWISWDFNQPYSIGKIHIWNYNEVNGSFTGRGVRSLTLETSTDGIVWTAVPGLSSTINWTNIGSNGTISGTVQAPAGGSTTYAGFDWVLPAAITTRHLRFNNTQNFGTSDAYTGLSEVIFHEAGSSNINLPNTSIAATASSTLDLGTASVNHTLGTLSIANNGTQLTLALGAGASLAFADSSALPWTGTLTLTGTFVSGSSLRFGTTSGGLTPDQLALIAKPGGGAVALNSSGFLINAGGYATWAATHAPTGTAKDDYDGDGVSNGAEYVLGGTATTNDLGKLPKISTSGGNVLFTFNRAQASIDGSTTVAIEVGTDLTTWPNSYAVPDGAVTTIPGVSVIKDTPAGFDTVTLSLPRAPDARKFARLKVTVAP